ncbi:hypothetical protein NPX13_g3559 [Xylaria arbuscula]|uniref:Uncharacterized protein n=1 Tax=Xylaria arbuscula TaxID=114810 RepID=A0A9W8NHN0_9PEZI|nr:hypothetical protein NPX13_g3559 [Xylaria arbuscula]
MKLLAAIAIAYFGVTWALPAPPETQAESQAQDLLYAPCSNALVFNSAYCCTRGALGTVSEYAYTLPKYFMSDEFHLLRPFLR